MHALSDIALERERHRLEVIIGAICPAWLRDDAEDLVQVALLRVNAIAEREGVTAFGSSYLRRVAHSVLVDEIRRRRRQARTLPEPAVLEPRAVRTKDPQIQAESRLTGRTIRECLVELSTVRRRAVTLHLLGHSVREAAELLDWSFKATENQVYRGLADLRRCLRGKGIEP